MSGKRLQELSTQGSQTAVDGQRAQASSLWMCGALDMSVEPWT